MALGPSASYRYTPQLTLTRERECPQPYYFSQFVAEQVNIGGHYLKPNMVVTTATRSFS